MLANYLTALAEVGANDPANHPPPLPLLCRICERQITPWWFEKHSEVCLQEHRAEMEVQFAQEALTEHRILITKVLDALEARKSRPSLSDTPGTPVIQAEYKGLLIGPPSNSSSGSNSGIASPKSSLSRDNSSSGNSHIRARSFTVRRPLSRIVELILDLCDTAIEINIPAINNNINKPQHDGDFRTQSPQSESRISQVLGWQTPSTSTLDQEQGLALLSTDTENVARAKVDAILRHRRIIEYSERIRVEFNVLVQDCIDAAMRKAADAAAGQLSDSSDEVPEDEDEDEAETPGPRTASSFVDSYDGATALGNALHPGPDSTSSYNLDRRQSLANCSTRSSSPLECPTPRSYTHNVATLSRSQSVNKHGTAYAASDTGDSDSSIRSSVISGAARSQSPGQEVALGRSTSSRDRKRRSLKLPSMSPARRKQSPGRMIAPQSPLRISKPRLPSGQEPSPAASPILATAEYSSPAMSMVHHRRQSSATSSSELPKPPLSPRMTAISNPQAKAVPPSIKDFEIIKPISKGAFGSVFLSKKKSTGDYFAIKVLKKADMVAKNQVTNVKAERAIMMWQGESDFVAKLYWTFSSKDYLYLVMEYLNGGDCASLVKVLGGLPEDWAKKYLAEVVLGIEHLHSRGIVHRDLKPDNLLIDQRGHLKLTDFGLSRMGLLGRQKRLLKSPNETTPDLLKHGPFTRAPSMASSRSASFDLQGHSPAVTPLMTPDLTGPLGQPSYFSLNRDSGLGREHSRRTSGHRGDSGSSDAFHALFRNFSLDDPLSRGFSIEEETPEEEFQSPDPYPLQHTASNTSNPLYGTPPPTGMPPPPMALFDPEDHNRRFVGTPDYLAPETINGLGQDEISDWWSMGCILFEFLYGYPPYHAETPEKVFENILARNIQWPDEEDCSVSAEAKNFMLRLMTVSPKDRLGANMAEKYSSGGEEIRRHSWFEGLNWDTLLEDEAQFVPAPENPEDTEYFDSRGATLQSFTEEMEDQITSPMATPGIDYPDRPHDALSRVRNQVNTLKRGLMPLHIPAHVRDGRNRRLSEPVAGDDFGSFAFKNLPVLEKANKDVIQKLRAEAMQAQSKAPVTGSPLERGSPGPSLEGSPLLPMPLKRALSANKGINRPASPSNLSQTNSSPSRPSQPSSPLLVQFSAGQNHERRKTSSNSSSLSHPSGSSLQPGTFIEVPRLASHIPAPSTASPVKTTRVPLAMQAASPDKGLPPNRPNGPISRARSQTVGSQEGDNPPVKVFSHHKRRSQVFDISPSSSDNDDPRAAALLRVQRRRQSSRRMSQFAIGDGPTFRPLDVLVCEDHPVSRMVMERLLEKLRCRTISVVNGPEAARYAMSEVQFDIIMMEYKLPQVNGADVARMIRDTTNPNTQTPIIAVTGYLKELPQHHHFDSLIEKPPTLAKLSEALCNLCQWKPPPPGYNPQQPQQQLVPSGLRQEARHAEDSPTSFSPGPFSQTAETSHTASTRTDSISSSFFGGDSVSSVAADEAPLIISSHGDDWSAKGLGFAEPPEMRPFVHPGLPHLLHQNSAPSVMSRPPRKQRSVEAVKAQRENIEKYRHECAESGDDEDEELGDCQVRARSPVGKQRSSKLGTEMMRTNSRGSISSGSMENLRREAASLSLTPHAELEEPKVMHHATITPPEVFPRQAAGDATKMIDMDATSKLEEAVIREVTPKSNAIANMAVTQGMPPPPLPHH